jgi:hypothetical protein
MAASEDTKEGRPGRVERRKCAPQLMSVKEALARPFGGSWLP